MAALLTAARILRRRGMRTGLRSGTPPPPSWLGGVRQGRLELLGEWADLRAEAGDFQGAYELTRRRFRVN